MTTPIDPDKPWRLPDAKPMTFDEMAARAQYEWQRAEDAEAEARALAEKLVKVTAAYRLEAMRRDDYSHEAFDLHFAQITRGKTNDHTD